MSTVEVIPALILQSIKEIEESVSLVEPFVKKVQLDVVDGKYARTVTWPFNLKEALSEDFKLPFANEVILEADLFIKYPEDYISDFLKIGIKSFVIHIDSTEYLDRCIHMCREAGVSVGVGIKPSGNFQLLEEYVDKIDFVQFMGNDKVGYHEVELDRKVLKQIADFHAAHPFTPIQIDIGVNEQTAPELIRAGATGLVSGSAVFEGGNIEENIQKLTASS